MISRTADPVIFPNGRELVKTLVDAGADVDAKSADEIRRAW
jgi:hypothetical protein